MSNEKRPLNIYEAEFYSVPHTIGSEETATRYVLAQSARKAKGLPEQTPEQWLREQELEMDAAPASAELFDELSEYDEFSELVGAETGPDAPERCYICPVSFKDGHDVLRKCEHIITNKAGAVCGGNSLTFHGCHRSIRLCDCDQGAAPWCVAGCPKLN